MLRTLSRRLAASVISLVILVTFSFAMVHLTPGGPAFSILGLHATADSVAAGADGHGVGAGEEVVGAGVGVGEVHGRGVGGLRRGAGEVWWTK